MAGAIAEWVGFYLVDIAASQAAYLAVYASPATAIDSTAITETKSSAYVAGTSFRYRPRCPMSVERTATGEVRILGDYQLSTPELYGPIPTLGECMSPAIQAGDLIFADPTAEIFAGDPVLCMNSSPPLSIAGKRGDNMCMSAKFLDYADGRWWLCSLDCAPIELRLGVTVIGKIVLTFRPDNSEQSTAAISEGEAVVALEPPGFRESLERRAAAAIAEFDSRDAPLRMPYSHQRFIPRALRDQLPTVQTSQAIA